MRLIDFQYPDRNQFHAINQFRINTPGRVKDFIIPDIVLFVNGIPMVVIECKDATEFTANPMYEAYLQIQRYSDQREETHLAGLSEGEPRLFHFNQFNILTCGSDARFGTITATEEYLFPWRDIYPSRYRTYSPPLSAEREQEVLIQGMLPPETLLDLVRNFVLFQQAGDRRVKVVARYQQYRAVWKIIDRLRTKATARERSGVIWHTQGSGKSLTMVFTVRKLRQCADLRDYKVIMVNDRTDLEDQLSDTATLAGEPLSVMERADQIGELASPASNLNMVMIHKFQDFEDEGPDYLSNVVYRVPVHNPFGEINPSERVLLMIDEAHRTQGGMLSENLFDAFPNATRLAFTGTPLVAEQYAKRGLLTRQRFGGYIDTYTLHDSVRDNATVRILYIGKTAHTEVTDKAGFERKFEDLCRPLSDDEVVALKKKYGTSGDLFEAERRIEAIAADLVDHYIDNILPDGFKAQVVATSKLAAVRYRRYIEQALAARLEVERARPVPDEGLIAKIAFLKARVVVSSQGTNERAEITLARREAHDDKAVDNFKRAFKPDEPLTGIAFLVVCDMLLTGFDAAIEQVMYLDKKVKDHNLLQTIARVNRTAKGKDCGYIVDYAGLTNHLRQAFAIYEAESQRDMEEALEDVESELPRLEQRYRRLLNLFVDRRILEIEDFLNQRITGPAQEYGVLERILDTMDDIRLRADFEVYLKAFFQSLNIVLPDQRADGYRVPARRLGYVLAQVKQRYQDESITLGGVGAKVRKLINEHLISLGIDPAIPLIELTDPDFASRIGSQASAKAKASEMEHAIRWHCKVHLNEDPAFYARLTEKLEQVIQDYEDHWDQLVLELEELSQQTQVGRQPEADGVGRQEAPFYDLIGQVAFDGAVPTERAEATRGMVRQILALLRSRIGIVNFWQKPDEVNRLKGDLSDILLMSDVEPIAEGAERLVVEVANLARHRHDLLLSGNE